MCTCIYAHIHNTLNMNYKSIISDGLKFPYMSRFQLIVYCRTWETWSKIIKVFGNSCNTIQNKALTCHCWGRRKSHWKERNRKGALSWDESSPHRCSEQPLNAYWHHQDWLGGRGYYGNGAMCWETDAFNCFNNFLGLGLPGLDLLSRKWRLSRRQHCDAEQENSLNSEIINFSLTP